MLHECPADTPRSVVRTSTARAVALPALAGLVGAAAAWQSDVLAAGVVAAGLVLIAPRDVAERRIVTTTVHRLATAAVVLLVIQAVAEHRGDDLLRGTAMGAAVVAGLDGIWLRWPRHIGLGDVRLLAVVLPVAAFVSWSALVWTLELTCLGLLVWCATRRLTGDSGRSGGSVPLAPALGMGFVVGIVMS